jgi:hypothetical protein
VYFRLGLGLRTGDPQSAIANPQSISRLALAFCLPLRVQYVSMSNAMDLLRSVRNRTDETEFYTPLPEGYRVGGTKYVVVLGTVISGLGKGIFSSSLAKLLKDKGLRVSPIKLEGYLNIDSGTLNPFRHGEVFVLDDGMERTWTWAPTSGCSTRT